MNTPISTTQMLKWIESEPLWNAPAAAMPAMNSRESPGRKKPISSPDSAKTMAKRRM